MDTDLNALNLKDATIVKVFAFFGPAPIALFFICFFLFDGGFKGVFPGFASIFFTYLAGVIPAIMAAFVFMMFASLAAKIGIRRWVLNYLFIGFLAGALTGAISGLLVFGTSPDLLQKPPLSERLFSNILVFGLPGCVGGAACGWLCVYVARRNRRVQ